jgi:subtilisin family serine protease/opacity protein-like surface antigen
VKPNPARRLPAVLFLLLALAPNPARAAQHYIPGEIVVGLRPEAPDASIRKLHARIGSRRKTDLPLIHGQIVRLPKGLSVEDAVERFGRDPSVLFAEPNFIRRPLDLIPNDPDLNLQWNLPAIEAPEAWSTVHSAPDVVVAVIDSGVDYTHPDLTGNIWRNDGEIPDDGIDNDGDGFVDDSIGWNFVGSQVCERTDLDGDGVEDCSCPTDDPAVPDDPGNNDPMDDYGHGTHVSGVLAAEGDNGIGVSGLLWQARVMPLKIIDRNACGSTGNEIQAIGYAVARGAAVINASFGGMDKSEGEKAAVRAAADAGVLFVAAAGNDGKNDDDHPVFPAGYDIPNVISVAASDPNDRLSPYSNFGQKSVDIAAPGDCILSTTPVGDFSLRGSVSCPGVPIGGTLGYLSGTSVATPLVSGTAALLLAEDPSLSAPEVKSRIMLTADPRSNLSGRVASGGRLNTRKALSREAGSGLAPGGGGCGAIDITGRSPTPPGDAIGFLLTLFFPVLIPVVRRLRRFRFFLPALMKFRIGLWTLMVAPVLVLASGAAGHEAHAETASPFDRPQSVSIKAGVHLYPSSDYFDANAGFVHPGDFRGTAGELEYGYRFSRSVGLLVSAGTYDGSEKTDGVCCERVRFGTFYALATPVFQIRTDRFDELYAGVGAGYYRFRMKQTGTIDESLSASVPGFHVLAGWRHALSDRWSALIEYRYAWASVKDANLLGDRLGIGGTTVSLGLSYHFPNPS